MFLHPVYRKRKNAFLLRVVPWKTGDLVASWVNMITVCGSHGCTDGLFVCFLAMTRSFGDFELKDRQPLMSNILAPVPEILRVELTQADRFLVIGKGEFAQQTVSKCPPDVFCSVGWHYECDDEQRNCYVLVTGDQSLLETWWWASLPWLLWNFSYHDHACPWRSSNEDGTEHLPACLGSRYEGQRLGCCRDVPTKESQKLIVEYGSGWHSWLVIGIRLSEELDYLTFRARVNINKRGLI